MPTDKIVPISKNLFNLLNALPNHVAVVDTLDYLVGALYSLANAQELGFKDRPSSYPAEYSAHLSNYTLNIAEKTQPHASWLAGYFFNSAIQRLAAAYDRIPKLLGAREKVHSKSISAKQRMKEVNTYDHANWTKVYDEVNAFKHDISGKGEGRSVTMADVMGAFAETTALLNNKADAIKKRYSPPKA